MKSLAALIGVVALAGCVSSQTTGIKSAQYDGVRFKGAVVIVQAKDLGKRQHYEDVLVAELASHHIRAVSGLKLFPPTDTWSPEEVAQGMAKSGLDTMLSVSPTGEYNGTRVIGTYTSANASASCYGNTCSGYGSSTTTNITETSHALSLDIRLVDYASGKTIWMAQSSGQGSARGIWGKMGMGSDVVEHIASDIGTQVSEAQIFASR